MDERLIQSNLKSYNYNEPDPINAESSEDSIKMIEETNHKEKGLHPLNPLRDIIADTNYEEQSLTGIALYDFEGELEDDLQFSKGDEIEIIEQNETGWWIGKNGSNIGSFPYNFVQLNLS